MWKENLRRILLAATGLDLEQALKEELECHDSQLMTTPHLSAIAHKEREVLRLLGQLGQRKAELLSLLDERNHRASPDEPCPPTVRNTSRPAPRA